MLVLSTPVQAQEPTPTTRMIYLPVAMHDNTCVSWTYQVVYFQNLEWIQYRVLPTSECPVIAWQQITYQDGTISPRFSMPVDRWLFMSAEGKSSVLFSGVNFEVQVLLWPPPLLP
jgi:hypothetical protein